MAKPTFVFIDGVPYCKSSTMHNVVIIMTIAGSLIGAAWTWICYAQ